MAIARATANVAVLGSLNTDVVLRVARLPAAGETVVAHSLSQHLGGKGANQAVAAARAGAAVRMIGAVGDDAAGAELVACLKTEGVDCALVAVDGALPTGTAHILVDDAGENQIAVVGGANRAVRAARVSAQVYLAQLESPLEAVAALLKERPAGTTGILNAAPFLAEARALFDLADVVVVNETELAGYTGADGGAADLARTLLCRPGQTILVTLGGQGSVAVDAAGIRPLPAPPATVVDTTGAGDCFCGYLAAGLARGSSLDDARRAAHRAAAIAVGRHGAIAAIPLASELGG
jgi:ribokinase